MDKWGTALKAERGSYARCEQGTRTHMKGGQMVLFRQNMTDESSKNGMAHVEPDIFCKDSYLLSYLK